MTIYVVSDGDYSDYGIMGVFDNLAAAEEFKFFHSYDNDIEEYDLNPALPNYDKSKLPFACRRYLGNDVVHVTRKPGETTPTTLELRFNKLRDRALQVDLSCVVLAKDTNGAAKIFNEKWAAFFAGLTSAIIKRHGHISRQWLDWEDSILWINGGARRTSSTFPRHKVELPWHDFFYKDLGAGEVIIYT